MVSKLYAAHQAGDKNVGVDIEGDGAAVKDVAAAGVWDLYLSKWWGLKLTIIAVNTVLSVDQVRASGPTYDDVCFVERLCYALCCYLVQVC